MNSILKIFLKYSSAIFLIRFAVGFIVEFLPSNTRLTFIFLAFIPVIFFCWLLTYNGTLKLSRYIRGRRKLEYTGYLIIGIPILLDILISFVFLGSLAITGPLLIFTICGLASYRASKKVYS